MWLLFTF